MLLVAATETELCGHEGLVCGIGPVEAAAATARSLALDRPTAVLHVGVAGADGLPIGRLVVGTEAVYADLSAAIPVVARALPDPALLAAARSALTRATATPIVTRAAVSMPSDTLSRGVEVEAMEGFAVLRACALADVPAVEVRAVANVLGEEDRTRWRIDEALAVLADVLPALVATITATRSTRGSR
jgi:futalosine hydrolase